MMNSVQTGTSDRACSWGKYREHLANNKDRYRALQLVSAATGYDPLPHQRRFHAARASQKLLLGGVGSGKSYASVCEAVVMSILNPGTSGVMIAQSYDAVQHILLPQFLEICDDLGRMGTPLLKRYNKSMARADLFGTGKSSESHVFFRSFSKIDAIRGWTLSWGAIDECELAPGRGPEYVWNTVAGRLRDPKAHVRQLWASTTPRGLWGITKLFVEQRKTEQRADWWAGRASTMQNPHLPDGFLQSLKSGYSKRMFQQEVLAEVLKPQSLVYPEYNTDDHVVPYLYDPSQPYILACDWGYANPAFLWIQGPLRNGEYVVFDEWHEPETPIGLQKEVIVQKCRQLGKDPDHTAADRAVKDLCSWLMKAFPSKTYHHRMRTKDEQSILNGVELVRSLLDPMDGPPRLFVAKHLTASDDPRSIHNALQAYRWKTSREGILMNQIYKDNVSDHMADSLRYAMMSVASDRANPFVIGGRDAYDKRKSRRRRF